MLGNWIKQTTTTTGTGNLTLSAVSGYPTALSQFAVGEQMSYVILDDATGLPIEGGIGSINVSGNLVREIVRRTYSGGSYTGASPTAVSLPAGTKSVICAASSLSSLAARPGTWANSVKGYGDANAITASGTITLVADRAYAIPFMAAVDSEIDAIAFRVTTAGAAGKLAKAAIFSVGNDGLPGVKLAESGTIAIDATGLKLATFSRFSPPPTYFACLLSDGAPIITASPAGINCGQTMGVDGGMAMTSGIYHAGATSLTFPAPWTPTALLFNGQRPLLLARCV